MESGDAIVVPEYLAQGWTVMEVKNTIHILAQIALTAGVLIVAVFRIGCKSQTYEKR